MSTLVDTAEFTVNEVYEIQSSDPVQGAATGAQFSGLGIDNQPHQQLANRTYWLYQNKAALAGSSSQQFNVANGTTTYNAINYSQLVSAWGNLKPPIFVTGTTTLTVAACGSFVELEGEATFTTTLPAINAALGGMFVISNTSPLPQTLTTTGGVVFTGVYDTGSQTSITLQPYQIVCVISDGYAWTIAWVSPVHGVQLFTTNGIFTGILGAQTVKVTAIGGGGGGSGCQCSSGFVNASGGGGGAGGFVTGYINIAPAATVGVTVGAGGAASTGNTAASSGGASVFGTYLSANGGYGAVPSSSSNTPGGVGGSYTGGSYGSSGGDGSYGQITSAFFFPGDGGASFFGGGGRAGQGGGLMGAAWGSGGGGAFDALASGTAYTGGAGQQGVVLVEY